MPEKQAVKTPDAPGPIPQNSQALTYNGMIYCSGMMGMTPDGVLVEGTVQDRARQALKNLSNVLEAGGSSLDNVVKVNVYLSNIADFPRFNQVYDEFFTKFPKPCRTCVGVYQLPRGTDVEIECTAFVSDTNSITRARI